MKNNLIYLIALLDKLDAPWAADLRRVLLSAKAEENQVNFQHCTVKFALSQARRRLESSSQRKKQTFGIESLVDELSRFDTDLVLDYYVVSTSPWLGTCFVLQDHLLGCEFVVKSGTVSRLGLWIDDGPIH